jgi:isopropylmalate/homocitrate/citramalate synthase
MSDTTHEALTPETVNRLRKIVFYEHSTRNALIHDCALGQITMGDVQDLIAAIERVSDRIEELEVKLAHAMEALKIDPWFIGYSGWKKYVKDTLADLKGQNDE